jgi:hypothetical protein
MSALWEALLPTVPSTFLSFIDSAGIGMDHLSKMIQVVLHACTERPHIQLCSLMYQLVPIVIGDRFVTTRPIKDLLHYLCIFTVKREPF